MPDLQYDDWGVLSPHRNIRVFYPLGARDTPLKARYEYEPEAVRKVYNTHSPVPHFFKVNMTHTNWEF